MDKSFTVSEKDVLIRSKKVGFCRNKNSMYMNTRNIVIVVTAFALLAAGCSKTKTETQAPSSTSEESGNAAVNIAKELDPSQNWIRFYPSDALRFNLLFPLTWWGDEENGDTHFVLRSRKGADGSRVDDVTMDFTVGPLTAKTFSEQITANMKDVKDASPVTTVNTDTGTAYAFATFVNAAGIPTMSVAVPYQSNQYIHIKVTGNLTHPYIGRMLQSITITK